MKDKEKGLLYHTMHSRPMPGCLPLFFLLALGVTALCLWIAPVKMPERVRSKGVGEVYVKEDRLTHFLLRRQSPLPLHLPNSADPEYQEDVAAASSLSDSAATTTAGVPRGGRFCCAGCCSFARAAW